MTGSIQEVVARLRCEVHATPQAVFDAGRARQPALAPHAHAPSVLADLEEEDEATLPERDALSLALLQEHHATGAALWSSMLIVAYEPMLTRLRYRLLADPRLRDELDQLVVCAFLSAIHALAARGATNRIPLRLRQATQRQVFTFLRRERREQHRAIEAVDAMVLEEAPFVSRSFVATSEKAADLSRLLGSRARGRVSQDSIEVVATTVLGQEHLRDYVARVGPADRAARERMYQRLKRRRSRAMQRLRELIHLPPPRLSRSS